jgi:hypothetical protein
MDESLLSPAVLHGGVTTFLALVFISYSDSHVMLTFFKIVSMIVLFGLFHGLLFLPSMLMICGSNRFEDENDVDFQAENGNKMKETGATKFNKFETISNKIAY